MSTTDDTPSSDHPFAVAWRTRDVDTWVAAMATDVTLHSPLLSHPFHGRDVARDLYAVLFEKFDAFDIGHQSRHKDTETIAWCGHIGTGSIEGVDVISYRPDGQIGEIRVFIRPLTALALFAGATGPGLARQKGRGAAAAAWLATRTLRSIFELVDVVTPHLLPLRPRRE